MERITLAQGMKRIFEAAGQPFTHQEWSVMDQQDRLEWAQLVANTLNVEVIGWEVKKDEHV